jgi:hypothetical protein
MQRNSFLYLIIVLLFAGSCSKGGGETAPPPEPTLSIATDPNPGGSVATALSATYPFKLLINSAAPSTGVKIDITQTRDLDNTVVFTQSLETTNATTKSVDLSLQNLTPGILYTIKVDVTSKTTATNRASTNFKLARK